jgi:hypothetical protein
MNKINPRHILWRLGTNQKELQMKNRKKNAEYLGTLLG